MRHLARCTTRWLAALSLLACQKVSVADRPAGELGGLESSAAAAPSAPAPAASNAALEVQKKVQADKLALALAPERVRDRRLAFGKGVLGQLTETELRVYATADFSLVASQLIEGPRLLVTLADGALLAVGARVAVRFDPSNKKLTTLAKPVLFPDSELRADAIVAERVWVFDATRRTSAGPSRPALQRLLLAPAGGGVLLPEVTLELESAAGGVLGTTREGVWLYLNGTRAERFGPGGAKLPGVALPELPGLIWVLPTRRLDQCYLFDDAGVVTRALVTPSFRKLDGVQLGGKPLTADVGDDGRLLAVIVVAGQGPRFELHTFDQKLTETARVPLPGEAPTGGDDWVRVVTRNQTLAVSSYEPRVAVGGPDRALIFDGQGRQVFSITSR